ncbi:MAG TPA: class I SAM-dependent methyltransferase [Anaerolineaceae bacterium]|nr:class I SAM-dependent methyltransferase [Anaerolineaceae bacterium]
MSEKMTVDLGNVQKTLFLPLWGRAFESKKARPMLIDPTAVSILEKVDVDFATMASGLSKVTQAAWIMRSVLVDETIHNFLKKFPQATIVNIGCGLDTTCDRVDNGLLTWYDLDLPDVIDLRRKFIPEAERRRMIAASFLDESWIPTIRVVENILFVAAGVFYYFKAAEIRRFLINMTGCFPGSEIIFDVSSSCGVKVANKMVIQRGGLDEKSFLQWGLDDSNTLLAWDSRIHLLQTLYYFGSKARSFDLSTRLVGWYSDRLKIQYMLHLRLGDIR